MTEYAVYMCSRMLGMILSSHVIMSSLLCYVTIVWDHVSLCDFFPCIQHLWKLLVEESDLVGHLQVSSCEGSCLLPSSLRSGSLHESLPSNQGLYIQWTIYVDRLLHISLYTFLSLQTVKDFFLLGRGELYLAFVDLAQPFMSLPPAATTQHGT